MSKKQTRIKFNLDGLEEIKKAVGNSYRTRVGVLGGHATRTDQKAGINNAELMLIQMFGSITNNIPARDPLYQPLVRHRRELLRKLASGSMQAAFEAKNYRQMFKLLGAAAEEIVDNAFTTSGDGLWPPNKPATIKAKGSSRPLINSSQLRRSITSDVVKNSSSRKGGLTKVS